MLPFSVANIECPIECECADLETPMKEASGCPSDPCTCVNPCVRSIDFINFTGELFICLVVDNHVVILSTLF